MRNVILSVALCLAATGCATTSTATAGGAPPKADIVDVAIGAGTFKTLVAAVGAAGLAETLKSPGPFTVFAPNDQAFAKLPEGTVEERAGPPRPLPVAAGAIVDLNRIEPRPAFHEFFTRRFFWSRGAIAVVVPKGDYEIWIWAPGGTTGKLGFGFGVGVEEKLNFAEAFEGCDFCGCQNVFCSGGALLCSARGRPPPIRLGAVSNWACSAKAPGCDPVAKAAFGSRIRTRRGFRCSAPPHEQDKPGAGLRPRAA